MKLGPMPVEEIHARNVAAGVINRALSTNRTIRGGLLPSVMTGQTLSAVMFNDLVDRVNALTVSR